MILMILLSLLSTFLNWLFSQWLNSVAGLNQALPAEKLIEAKQDFLDKVRWRFWLGSSRVQYASVLFDKAAARYNEPRFTAKRSEFFSKKKMKELSRTLTEGLTLD